MCIGVCGVGVWVCMCIGVCEWVCMCIITIFYGSGDFLACSVFSPFLVEAL